MAAHIGGVTTVVGNGLADITWFNGHQYEFHISSVNSQNRNEFISPCYNLGPLSQSAWTGASSTLYALFVTGATMHQCPDGTQVHDHLIDAIPGTPGFHPVWKVIVVVDGPNPDPSIIPIKSVAALQAAATAGKVVIFPWDGTTVKATIVGIPLSHNN